MSTPSLFITNVGPEVPGIFKLFVVSYDQNQNLIPGQINISAVSGVPNVIFPPLTTQFITIVAALKDPPFTKTSSPLIPFVPNGRIDFTTQVVGNSITFIIVFPPLPPFPPVPPCPIRCPKSCYKICYKNYYKRCHKKKSRCH